MMNLNFHKWMDLEVLNNYFQKGVCHNFNILPFQDTSRKMRNYEILIKKESNIFSLYAGINVTETFVIAANFSGLEDLYFQLTNNDPLFFNYTDTPSNNENELYYFENNANLKQPEIFQKNLFVSSQDLISFKPKQFNLQLPDSEAIIEIKDSNEQLILNQKIDGSQINNYLLNLNHCNNGVYHLWINDQFQETFFISDEAVNQDCIGIVRINMKEIIAQYSNNLKYTINFNARSVFWEYQVVVSKSRKIQVHEMSISGTNQEKYQGPIEQEVIGGQTAQVFTTPDPVQLQNKLEQSPQLQVTYSNDFSNRQNQIEIKLPNPDIEQIKKYNQGENKGLFFSSLIVYV